MRFLIARSLVVSAALALGSASAQTTLHVPTEWPTIQQAIDAASDGDTVLVAPGTYDENLDYLGKAITVDSEAGASSTVIRPSRVRPVVSFGLNLRSLEGTDSILRGFTLTGGSSLGGGGGIDAQRGATPLIQDCIVTGNTSALGPGGVSGSAILEDCRIQFNLSEESGGGFAGSPTLRRCLVLGNSAWESGGAGIGEAGTLLESCTLVGNSDGWAGVGGVGGTAMLVNCILKNAGVELSLANASYCCVEGGFAGTGNIDADPLFRDALNGDYHLLPGSPCIDTGSPSSPLDFDESRADMGTLAFTHALAAPRNGSGVNLPLLMSASAPVLGTSLALTIHSALVPQAALSGITIRQRALVPGVMTPFGELLVGGATLGHAQQSSNGVADSFTFAIPPSLALIGFEGFAQGYVIRQGTPFDLELGNALRLLIGQ